MTDLENNLSSGPPPEPQAPDPGPTSELEMRRRASAVLEVLAGARTPSEAAEALSISLPRYYLLEARALEGLITSCEPRPRGWAAREGRSVHALRRENDRLRADLSRTQALARAIQRTTGLPEKEEARAASGGRVHRKRRPRARALRAAKALLPEFAPAAPPLPSSGVVPPH